MHSHSEPLSANPATNKRGSLFSDGHRVLGSNSREKAFKIISLWFSYLIFGLVFLIYLSARVGSAEYAPTMFQISLVGVCAFIVSTLNIQLGVTLMIFAAIISPKLRVTGYRITIEDIVIVFVFFAWLSRVVGKKMTFAPTDLRVPILFYIATSMGSTMAANIVDPEFNVQLSMFYLLKNIQYFLIFLITLNTIKTYEDAKRYILLLMFAAFLAALGSIYFHKMEPDNYRQVGPLGSNPNVIGGLYSFFILIAVSLLLYSRVLFNQTMLTGVFVASLFPVTYSLSRTSWIALVFGCLVLGFMRDWRVFFFMLIGFIIVSVIATEQIIARAETLTGILWGEIPSSGLARMTSWKRMLPSVIENPIWGRGKGSVWLGTVDNEYVLQTIEGGALGLFFFLMIIWRILKSSIHIANNTKDRMFKGFSIGVFAGTTALLVHSIASTSFTVVKIMVVFYFTVGILYGIKNLEDGEEQPVRRWQTPPDILARKSGNTLKSRLE